MMVVLFVLALVALVATHIVLERRLVKLTKELFIREEARRVELDELERARTTLLYKQQKQSVAVVARNNRAASKLSDEVRDLHRNAVELHKSVERMVRASENG